ncbi:MAG: hypothetical protein ACP5PQ_05645, partial [Thermoproteota archaeon]
VHSVNNLTIAYKQEGLPRLDKSSIWLLTNATQIPNYGSNLVDFEPIVFKSVDGNDFYIIPNPARETWIAAEILKRINESFDVLKHPEMFEGLNGKIISNAWSLFDAKYGISYIEREVNHRTIKPSDKDVLDL